MEAGQNDHAIRILIAGGYVIFRQGLRILLERESDIHIVGEVKTGDEVLDLARRTQPDILLLDIEAPDYRSFDVLRQMKTVKDTEAVRSILLMPSLQRSEVVRAMRLGACGILAKDAPPEALIKSIRAVMNDVMWVDREIVQTIIQVLNDATAVAPENRISDLTSREKDIIRAIVDGQVNKEIAETFHISEYTVKHHLTRIFDKLRVANRVELAIFALGHGLADNKVSSGLTPRT